MPCKETWSPQRLDSNESRRGRDISRDIDRASKDRSAPGLVGSKSRSKC